MTGSPTDGPAGRTIPASVRNAIPARFVEMYRIVPLSIDDEVLTIAHPRNVDPAAIRELQVLLDHRVRLEVRDAVELEALIRGNYGLGAPEIDSLVRAEASVGREPSAGGGNGATSAERSRGADLSEDTAIVSFVNGLIRQACDDGATDLHLEPYDGRLRVRFRIDGLLHDVPVPAEVHRFHLAIASRIKVMARLDIAEQRLPQDGKFRVTRGGEDLDFRVSVLPTPHGEAINIRVLADRAVLRDLGSLGLSERDLRVVDEILRRPHGVVLVTGPTGSGKTTTLYSFLQVLNSVDRKILTIEDPIEYDMPGVSQIQVFPRIGLTFAKGLRSMLRHDPDVMMVGEIRDEETAQTVVRVALTGHLVFSTVHTNDAAGTPIRLIDMKVEPYLVASSVECVIAQRLVRLVCESCAASDDRVATPAALGITDVGFDAVFGSERPTFTVGRGCDRCRGTGYRGRTAVFEIVPVTHGIRDRVLARASSEELRAEALRGGYWPLRWKGLALAATGRTTVEEVLRVSQAQDRS